MNTYIFKVNKGLNYVTTFFLSILLLTLGTLIFFKIQHPEHTGLFFQNGRFRAFGILKITENTNEVLGNAFIPIIAATIALFAIIMIKNIKK